MHSSYRWVLFNFTNERWSENYTLYLTYSIYQLIFFVKVDARNANHVWATARIFDFESWSWKNRNFINWKIAHPFWNSNPRPRLHAEGSNRLASGTWHFPIHSWGYWFWRYRHLFVKVNTRNTIHARATASISDCEQLFLKQLKLYEVEDSTPLVAPRVTRELRPTSY